MNNELLCDKNFLGYSALSLSLIVVGVLATWVVDAQGKKNVSVVHARQAADFLDSIGTQSAISVRGEKLEKTIECAKYLGARWFRAGIEGSVPIEQFVRLHKEVGLKFSWGLGSGSSDLLKLIKTGRLLAKADALLAFEGNNEPNNWGVAYLGQSGGRDQSWIPVAHLQRDLYRAVKSDPLLKKYPVFSISENGAEKDNVGLQFLTIPKGAGTAMPDGTKFADFANVHNYIYHPNSPNVEDNKTWNAADPTSACKVDGLFGEYGLTWGKHFPGYSARELLSLPRVTTETGCTIEGKVTERIHGLNLLTLFLDQFKRGWSYSCVYLMRDRVDEGGNQQFGFFKPDYSPRLAATYLHNLTTILADSGSLKIPGRLDYYIQGATPTVHDLLLQKSDGTFFLVLWNERLFGSDSITVRLVGMRSNVRVYDPTVGDAALVGIPKTDSLQLSLSDHPVVVEIQLSAM